MAGITKKERLSRNLSKAMTKRSPEVVKKLEEVFAIDGTIEEACFYAGISRATYHNWVNEDKELLDRFTALRNRPILKARQTVVSKLGDSYMNAMDYLKRKRKKEFGDSGIGEGGISVVNFIGIKINPPAINGARENVGNQPDSETVSSVAGTE